MSFFPSYCYKTEEKKCASLKSFEKIYPEIIEIKQNSNATSKRLLPHCESRDWPKQNIIGRFRSFLVISLRLLLLKFMLINRPLKISKKYIFLLVSKLKGS